MFDAEGNEYCEIDPTWEEALQELLSDYHATFSKLFADSEVVLANVGEELIPFMFVVSQVALTNSNYENRDFDIISLLDIFIDWIDKNGYKTDILKIFDDRLHLYVDVISDKKKPRYEWLMFNTPEGNTDFISRCHAVFGDILFNPACANDYENAPAMIHDIFSVVDFRPKMVDFYFSVIGFCHKVVSAYNLYNYSYIARQPKHEQQPQKKKQDPKRNSDVQTNAGLVWLVLAGVAVIALMLIALKI